MPFLRYKPRLKFLSRNLRSAMTSQENLLWSYLRRKQIKSIQFFRQRAIETYIVDFYAPSIKLVIEIDGIQHSDPDALARDQKRDADLRSLGLHVLRFDNVQIERCLDLVLMEIEKYIENYYERII